MKTERQECFNNEDIQNNKEPVIRFTEEDEFINEYLPYDDEMTQEEEFSFTGAVAVYAVCTAFIIALIVITLYLTTP
ncbi:MAG: hypothetical protein IJY59_01900 [Bacteroidaceae bacterium]|nr:hypothetical protein [Bacteroidaceae bacterium]